MPVSPADFEFYSRMTGQPIPNTPAGRMAIAPQVYNMRRGGGGFGRVLRGAAKGALAAGALAGAGALALATQEEMAKTQAPAKEQAKGSVDLDKDVPKTVKASALRDEADRLSASVLGASRGSAMSAPDLTGYAQSQPAVDDRQYLLRGSDDELIGSPATAEELKEFGGLSQRYSKQTVVPQADPNIANESRGAQLASTSEPTQPRVEVRQQPSSGVQVTDLSNVAAKDYTQPSRMAAVTPGFKDLGIEQRQFDYGPVQKATDPVESAGLQAVELQDATPHGSPFQDPESFEMSRREGVAARQDIKAGNKPFLREYISLPGTNYEGIEFYPEEVGEGGISAAKVTFKSNPDQEYTYQVSPQGLQTLKNVAYGGQPIGESGTKFMKGMMSRGELIDPVKALLQSNAPAQAAPKQAASKSPVELAKQMVSDAGKSVVGAVLGGMARKKVNPREEQIRRDVDRALGALSPEQKETEVQRRLGQ